MHSILRSIRNPIFPAIMAVVMLQTTHAVVIKITSSDEEADRQAMSEAAQQLRTRWYAAAETDAAPLPAAGRIHGFGYQMAEGPIVLRSFSMVPGTVAYYWSDHTFRFESGFRFQGNSMMFGKKAAPRLAKEALNTVETGPTWITGFGSATLTSTALQLEFELAKSEVVTAMLFDVRGKNLASWTWREANAGRHVKSLSMNHPAKTGLVFLRWKAGERHMIRRVRVE